MKQRLITGIIAGGFFLGMCWLGGTLYHVLIMLMALIGYYEFVRMTRIPAFQGTAILGYLGVVYLTFPWRLLEIDRPLSDMAVLWLFMLFFLAVTVISKNEIPIGQIALLYLGMVYVGIGFAAIAETRNTPDGHGLFWTFLMLASIWSSDAGAYFAGRRFGKNKLWPAISPNKTVEGALGGVLLAVIVAVIFALASFVLLRIGR